MSFGPLWRMRKIYTGRRPNMFTQTSLAAMFSTFLLTQFDSTSPPFLLWRPAARLCRVRFKMKYFILFLKKISVHSKRKKKKLWKLPTSNPFGTIFLCLSYVYPTFPEQFQVALWSVVTLWCSQQVHLVFELNMAHWPWPLALHWGVLGKASFKLF